MLVKFRQTIIRFWFFLSYPITTVTTSSFTACQIDQAYSLGSLSKKHEVDIILIGKVNKVLTF